jgi:hypothetical protein
LGVAAKHYLQVTDDHFQMGAGQCSGAESEAAWHRRYLRRGAGVKKIKRFIPMAAPADDIIHITAKKIKIMKECHKARNKIL